MNKKFENFICDMPLPPSLGWTFGHCMDHQIEEYEARQTSIEQTLQELWDEDNLIDRDEKLLEVKKRFFDVDILPATQPDVERRLCRMVLCHGDVTAWKEIASRLGIFDLELLADNLLRLRMMCPEAYRALMRGSLGTAVRLLKACQYPMTIGPDDVWAEAQVRDIVVMMARLWIAADLQNLMALCHVRIFRPTNSNLFDHTPCGGAPQAQGGAAMLLQYLDAFDRVAEVYLAGLRQRPAEGFLNAARHLGGPALGKRFGPGIRGPYEVNFHEFARPASFKDSKFVTSIGLDIAGQVQLAIWRKIHGYDLETHVEAVVKQCQDDARRLRAAIMTFMSKLPRNTARGNANGVAPLVTAYLGVEQAISWASRPSDPDHARSKTDGGASAAPQLDAVEMAVIAVWEGRVPSMPFECATKVGSDGGLLPAPKSPFKDCAAVRSLFFAYRTAIIEDPDFLPTKARKVTCKDTGQIVTVKYGKQATEIRGVRYTFEELVELSPTGSSPTMPKPLLTTVSNDVNRFRSTYEHSASTAAKAAVKEARGAIGWRLTA